MAEVETVAVPQIPAWCSSCTLLFTEEAPALAGIRVQFRDLALLCPVCRRPAPIINGMADPVTGFYRSNWWESERIGAPELIPYALVERLKEVKEEVRRTQVVPEAALQLLGFANETAAEKIRTLPEKMQWVVFVLFVTYYLVTRTAAVGAGVMAINAFFDWLTAEESRPLSNEEVASFRRVLSDDPLAAEALQAALASASHPVEVAAAPARSSPGGSRPPSPPQRSRQVKAARRPKCRPSSRREDRPRDPPPGKKR